MKVNCDQCTTTLALTYMALTLIRGGNSHINTLVTAFTKNQFFNRVTTGASVITGGITEEI